MTLVTVDAPLEVENPDGSRRRLTQDDLVGPQGPPGASLTPYVHDQAAPASTWSIAHGLGAFPAVAVVDSGGTVVLGELRYDSPDALTLIFSAPFTGKAYLTR